MKRESKTTGWKRALTLMITSMIKVIGARARRLWTRCGLTRAELGDVSGRSPNYIGAVELGKRDPSLSTAETAKLYEEMPEELQRAVVRLLRAAQRRSKHKR
jgi:transcriptional regulator with XRE-family HTH domain